MQALLELHGKRLQMIPKGLLRPEPQSATQVHRDIVPCGHQARVGLIPVRRDIAVRAAYSHHSRPLPFLRATQNRVGPGEMGMDRAAILRQEKWHVAQQWPVLIIRTHGKYAKTLISRKGKIGLP